MIGTVMSLAAVAANWIAGSYEPPAEADAEAFFRDAPNDVLERRFAVRDAEVRRALWRVAAPGMRDLFVNGTRVSATALPPWTPYARRVLEESFDVTALIRPNAENEVTFEGNILGTCSADLRDLVPAPSRTRKMYRGRAQAVRLNSSAD